MAILSNQQACFLFGRCLVWAPPGHPLGLFALANQRAEVAFSTSPHPRRYSEGRHLQALIARTTWTRPCRPSPPLCCSTPSGQARDLLRATYPLSWDTRLSRSVQPWIETYTLPSCPGRVSGMYPRFRGTPASKQRNGTHGCFLVSRREK